LKGEQAEEERIMAISKSLKNFLEANGADYEVVRHRHAESASRSAHAANVPGDQLAKAVLIVDDATYLLAIVPATRRLHLGRLHQLLGEHVGLATETEVAETFYDCDRGAIPALASAYGLDALVDESLLEQDAVYLEGGDHESLVKIGRTEFLSLLAEPRRGDFSDHV
jgi:Ala-tRNA(Pro) deacylase